MPDEDKMQESILHEAQTAPEPGELKKAQVLEKGNNEDSAPMIAKDITSAGYVYIYDTRTGDVSRCNRNMLMQHLKKTRPDGSTVFTLTKPDVTPKVGKLKCFLHPDSDDRELYNEMGLAVCKKSNLANAFQQKRHMMKRHKMEWETIEQIRTDKEKKEDREFQRAIMQMATTNKEPEVYESDKDKKARLAKE